MRHKRLATLLLLIPSLTAAAADKAADKPTEAWVGTWAASPMALAPKMDEPAAGDSTYRNIVRVSLGGKTARVQFTNEFGKTPLVIGSAHIAVSAGGGAVQAGTDHPLTFGGQPSVTIPAGGFMLSDDIAMDIAPLASLAVSVYVADRDVSTRSCHELGSSTNYITKGDASGATTLTNPRTITSWCFVKGIDVRAASKAFAIVTLGDSITDGALSTPDANHRWPDSLAERLQSKNIAVLNEAISGNRILHDGAGPNAVARFDRDVLAQSGVKYLIILEGINDIGWPVARKDTSEEVSAADLILAVTQLVERAHQHGIKVIGATLTPYGGAGYSSDQGEQKRTALNQWYRTAGVVDGVIDFDKVTRDPAKPLWFNPEYDSGDHLHPKDAGYKAMADSIDLSLFR